MAGPSGIQKTGSGTDIPGMRRYLALSLALVLAACTSPARTDAAEVPPLSTTTTVPPTSTSSSIDTTTTTPVAVEGPDIVAWLHPDAPERTLAESIAAWEGIAALHAVSGEQALVEFSQLFARRPELAAGVPVEALPSSLRIELSHPSFLGEVAARLRSLADVADVATAVSSDCNAFPGWNVVVFAEDDRQLTRLRNVLLEIDGLTDISVVSRQEAHAEFVARFGDTGVEVRDLLVSLRARSSNPVALTMVRTVFDGDEAVRGVQVFNPGAPDCS